MKPRTLRRLRRLAWPVAFGLSVALLATVVVFYW
jgi:hypothetical protein